MTIRVRQAVRSDCAAMHAVRMSVRENRLVSVVLGEADYVEAIEGRGRGWLIELDGAVVAFAIGDASNGSIWALFVEPAHERRGFGRRLHDVVVAWLFEQGHQRLWLSTDPHTRAQKFYETAGWSAAGPTASGEVRYELAR